MAQRLSGARLASLLWLVAAALAWTAVAIRYYRRDEVSWAWAAAGLFFLAMGLSAWKRARLPSSGAASRDRDPAE